MRQSFSLFRLYGWQYLFTRHYFSNLKYFGIKCFFKDNWEDLYNMFLSVFGYHRYFKTNDNCLFIGYGYLKVTPLFRRTQWWVEDQGFNWNKTTWRYVLTGKHSWNKLKMDRP